MSHIYYIQIAQVHRATLRDGQEVVVKVQHEGIKTIILEVIDFVPMVLQVLIRKVPYMLLCLSFTGLEGRQVSGRMDSLGRTQV